MKQSKVLYERPATPLLAESLVKENWLDVFKLINHRGAKGSQITDVYIRLLSHHIKKYDGEQSSIGTYIHYSTYYTLFNLRKKERQRIDMDLKIKQNFRETHKASYDDTKSLQQDLDIQTMIENIDNHEERRVIALFMNEKMSRKEIAVVTSIPLNVVQSYLTSWNQTVSEYLKED